MELSFVVFYFSNLLKIINYGTNILILSYLLLSAVVEETEGFYTCIFISIILFAQIKHAKLLAN